MSERPWMIAGSAWLVLFGGVGIPMASAYTSDLAILVGAIGAIGSIWIYIIAIRRLWESPTHDQ